MATPEKKPTRPALPETVDASTVTHNPATVDFNAAETPGTGAVPTGSLPAIPGYRILGVLGRGGMGIVYRAEQVGLKRVVALKMILAGPHAGPAESKRFQQEAEAVAKLRHPGIVQVFDVGEYQGQPWFSLEFCPGGSLAGLLKGAPQLARTAAQLVASLAHAMQAAHDAGIVHRDLKPGNILLQASGPREGAVSSSGQKTNSPVTRAASTELRLEAKITDFGLAKQIEEDGASGLTQSGAILGTPSYMAPEQAEGRLRDVGPPCDIYALGAILYECLTGRPPFRGASLLDTLEQVRTQEPVSPRSLNPSVPRDLETICLKCLAKEPRRRYESAEELAEDLERYLDGEPIRARPVGWVEKVAKWVRRRPAIAGLIVAVVIVTGIGAATATVEYIRAEVNAVQATKNAVEATKNAEQATKNADEKAIEADNARKAEAKAQRETAAAVAARNLQTEGTAWSAWGNRDPARVDELLDLVPPQFRTWEWHHLLKQRHAEVVPDFPVPQGKVTGLTFAPDGRHLILATDQSGLRMIDLLDRRVVRTFTGLDSIRALVTTSDGRGIAAIGLKREERRARFALQVWDTRDGKVLFEYTAPDGMVLAVLAALPASPRLVVADQNGNIHLIDFASGQVRLNFARGTIIRALAVDRAETRLAICESTRVRIVALDTGRDLPKATSEGEFVGRYTQVLFGDLELEGERLIAGSEDGRVTGLWGRFENRNFGGHDGPVVGLAASPLGHRVYSLGADGQILVRVGGLLAPVFTFRSVRDGWFSHLALSPDGRLLAAADAVGIHVWDATGGPACPEFASLRLPVHALAYLPNAANLLAAASEDGTLRLWDTRTGIPQTEVRGPVPLYALSVAPDGKLVAFGGEGGLIRLWDPVNRREGKPFRVSPLRVDQLAFHPEGRLLAIAGGIGLYLYDVVAGKVQAQFPEVSAGSGLLWLPDGRRLVVSSFQSLYVLDTANGKTQLLGDGIVPPMHSLSLHPDGKHLAALSVSGNGGVIEGREEYAGASVVRVWNLDTGRREAERTCAGEAVTFTPDGERLLVLGRTQTTLWDTRNYDELTTTLPGLADKPTAVAFQPARPGLVPDLAYAISNPFLNRIQHGTIPTRLGLLQGLATTPRPIEHQLRSRVEVLQADAARRVWLAIAPDGLIVRKADTGAAILTLRPEGRFVYQNGALAPAGNRVLVTFQTHRGEAGQPNPVVFDVATGKRVAELADYPGQVRTAAFSADGRTLWTLRLGDQASRKGEKPEDKLPDLSQWDATTGKLLRRHLTARNGPEFNLVQSIHPELGILILRPSGRDGAGVLDLETLAARFTAPDMNDLAPDGTGRHVVGRSVSTGEVSLFDAKTGQVVRRVVIGAKERLDQQALSPNGRYLACLQEGVHEIVFDLETGQRLLHYTEMHPYLPHPQGPGLIRAVHVTRVVFLDDRTLLVAHADGAIDRVALPLAPPPTATRTIDPGLVPALAQLCESKALVGVLLNLGGQTGAAEEYLRAALAVAEPFYGQYPLPTTRGVLRTCYRLLKREKELAILPAATLDEGDWSIAPAPAGLRCLERANAEKKTRPERALAFARAAVKLLEQTPEGKPYFPQALQIRVGLLEKAKEFPAALADLDRLIALAGPPQKPMYQSRRALCLARSGDVNAALKGSVNLEKLPTLPPDAGVLFAAIHALALAHYRADQALPEEERRKRADEQLKIAMSWLDRVAKARGFEAIAARRSLYELADYAALRETAEFKQFLERLAPKPAP